MCLCECVSLAGITDEDELNMMEIDMAARLAEGDDDDDDDDA